MPNLLARYTRWLHTRWPAGQVEKLPEVGLDGVTSVPGLRVVGDLTGVPLLKFSADTGARAVQAILREPEFRSVGANRSDELLDLAIVGGGVSGLSAALEAKAQGLRFEVYEAAEPFATIANFPKAKPIFTYPTEMRPAGPLRVSAPTKESLLAELEEQRAAAGIEFRHAHITAIERQEGRFLLRHEGGAESHARRVILAIGRTGHYRMLEVPGEQSGKVFNRLLDPKEHAGQNVLVVGGGDSALESALALSEAGARVTLCHRGTDFARAKAENVRAVAALEMDPGGSLRVLRGHAVASIAADTVTLRGPQGTPEAIANDAVFAMLGREAPLDFLRRCRLPIRGEFTAKSWLALTAFSLLIAFIYLWKSGWILKGGLPALPIRAASDSLLGFFVQACRAPGYWFTMLYTAMIVFFGLARIRRRRTPYVRWQTVTLMAIQVVPLFLLPELLLPWADAHGWLPAVIRDNLFPNHEYWRAYGFVFAWPLFLSNLASSQPHTWWLVIGLVQTFVLLPLLVWRYGKGAYCGWICSCGALAETMGDTHRTKMWHGPTANRFNMTGQVALVLATILTAVTMLAWVPSLAGPLAPFRHWLDQFYRLSVDLLLGGAIGIGFYFWFSGRVWCRFACPLAALMHIYGRFSRFRIFAEKKKCISCNVCTSVCHQGIDVMSFANKGLPMEDPQCVRCSACVQSCPTGTLSFGSLGSDGQARYDRLPASLVQIEEGSTLREARRKTNSSR